MTRRLIVEADGGARGNPGPAGYGAAVRDARTGAVLAEVSAALGRATNNVAEYSGLIAGLREAARIAPGADTEVRMDSRLVVEQMSGRWQIKHPGLRPLAEQARQAARSLGRVRYTWVPRERNAHADRLANEAMDAAEGDAAEGGGGDDAPGGPARGQAGAGLDPGDRPRGEPGAGSGDGRRGSRFAEGSDGKAGAGCPEQVAAGPVTTLLLRHGETPLSPERRFAGRGDIPLTENGLRQARAAAARLAARGALAAIVSSPLRRARRTADAVAAATGLPVAVDDGWAETDFGAWEGLTYAEAMRRWPEEFAAWQADPEVAPPGGESLAAATRRVLPALGRLLVAHPGARVLVVSHVTPIKIVLRHALLAPPDALRRMHLDVACLCEIDWDPRGAGVVRSLNDTAHLDPREYLASAYAGSHGGRAGRAAAPGPSAP